MDTIRLIGSPLYQWEIGRKIEITPSPHTRVDKVEFSHPGDANTLSLVPREENGVLVADIPNVLLQSGNIIFVYLVHAPDGGVETTTDHILRVIRRPKPADYVYTETEILTYHALDARLKELEGEGLAQAVADYLKENPVQAGATKEEAEQIQQNKTNIEQLAQEKLDASKLPEAVNEALAQAKASGEFDGKDGQNGSDYVLTEADKQEIAGMVEIPEGGTVTDEQIASAVEDYMAEHPVEGGSVELDTSLTQSGKAADAKAVGDALTELESKISAGGGSSSDSDGAGTVAGYVELGTLPYTVGNVTELYLEPSEDCSLVIGASNDNNLITDLASCLVTSSNTVIDELVGEEFVGTHTVILTATNTNAGNNFYDVFKFDGLTVGTEYTFSCTVDLSGISGSAYANIIIGSNSVNGKTTGERISLTFTASETAVSVRLYLWTGTYVAKGDFATFADCLLCEGTSTDFGSSVTYALNAGEKTKVVFNKGTVIPAVDGVTVTVFKYVEAVIGDLFVFLGDSIPCFDSNTGGVGAIPDYLREKCGGTWKNFCVGGTTMSAYRATGNGYEYFTLDEWADAIATGDFTRQEQGVADGAVAGSTSYGIANKVADAKTLDWGSVKRIFFAYGTNDLAYDVSEVGSANDTATKHGTMCGALKYAVQTILTAYPTMEIAVCGIIYRYADGISASEIIAANEAIKATCESIGISFIPLFENMGVNEWNRTSFLYDGSHLNANGKERYADTVKRFMCL